MSRKAKNKKPEAGAAKAAVNQAQGHQLRKVHGT